MEDLVLQWPGPEGEELILHCHYETPGKLQVEIKRRLASSVQVDVPVDFVEDIAEWFEKVHKRVRGRMSW